jgi:mono/diheme cytochrome c family protein
MKFARSSIYILGATFFAAAFSGCGRDQKKPAWDLMPHMNDTFAVKAQHLGPFGEGMRVPPAGTVSINAPEAYRYANDPEAAGRDLKNPVARTKPMLLKGQTLYNTYCMVCHGVRGEGNGTIVPKFPQPPTLHSDKVRGWTDGRIYHVLTVGQNLMPSYASQLDPQERWAVINYVRVLQRALNPTDADIREIEMKKAGR